MIEWIVTYRVFLAAVVAVGALAWIDHALRLWALRNPAHRHVPSAGWARQAVAALFWLIVVGVVAAHVVGVITGEPAPGTEDCHTEQDNRGPALTCD